MKAIILARVSTEEQREAGNSLPAQVERLKSYCKRKGFEIVKTFSFDESAYKTKRDEFDKILEHLKGSKEKIAVCFDKVDRLSRNVFDKRVSLLYEKAIADEIELHFASDGQVISNNMSAVEKFQFGMSLGLAKYYSDAISDNVKRAYEQKLRNGEWIGKAPLGYKNIDLENDKKSIVVDESRAFLIKKLFELYASGKYSMKTLTKEMAKQGLKGTKTGEPIATSQMEKILKNPFYYGTMRVKKQLYPHNYDPIISRYLFNKVQEVINSYNRQRFKRTNKPYIFRGLLKCSDCGYTVSPYTKIKKNVLVYYRCTNYGGNCKNVTNIKEKELVDQIAEVFKSIKLEDSVVDKLKDELRRTHESEKKFYEQSLRTIKNKLENIDRRLKVMYDDRLDGRITTEDYDKKVKEYDSEKQDLMIQYEEHNKADINFYITASRVLDLSNRAWEIFQSSEPEEKTQLLKFVLKNLELRGRKLVYELKNPFQGIVEYQKTGNWLGR